MKKHILPVISIILSLTSIVWVLIHTQGLSDKPYLFIGGVIRNSGEGWYPIINEGHTSVNIESVETTEETIIIHYQPVKKVITFITTPDETMASEGYSIGAKVGLDAAYLYIYDKELNQINPKNYVSDSGNIWICGMFSLNEK
jgi:hypothetical protein